jgi:alkylhydroperoxidase family enzyme
MTWLAKQAEGDTPLDNVYGLLPEAYARHQALVDHIWKPGLVDPVVLELCRLRVAQIVRSPRDLAARTPAATAAGLSEDKIGRLAQWPTADDYTAAERAALCFAEMYVIDPSSVTDAMTEDVKANFTPSEVATLTTGIAVFDALARFQVALAV